MTNVATKECNQSINYCSPDWKEELYNLLLTQGFAVLKNHHVDLTKLHHLYCDWLEFFTSKKKFDYLRSEITDQGYVEIDKEYHKNQTSADLKEFYQSHWGNPFPRFIDFKITKVLLDQMYALGIEIIQCIHEFLPQSVKQRMSTQLPAMIKNCNKHSYRVIRYPEADQTTSAPRSGSHTDICLLTLLPPPSSDGLMLKDIQGNWHSPELDDNKIIVFNSDILELVTEGYLKATTHQVKTRSPSNGTERFSLPIFIHPHRETKLTNNITVLEVLRKRFTELGYRGDLFQG